MHRDFDLRKPTRKFPAFDASDHVITREGPQFQPVPLEIADPRARKESSDAVPLKSKTNQENLQEN